MVEVSIVCLIYKSVELAEAVYESLIKYTPMLSNGQAEFIFVANDPSREVVEYLNQKNIPYTININKHLSERMLYRLGFGSPEYMRRVYQGYNQGILKAKGKRVVLINSDNFFSKDWLENLLKYSDYKRIVSSTLIEPGQKGVGVFPFAINKNFGKTLDEFEEEDFLSFSEKISKTGYTSGGAYMPCLVYKDILLMAGLYPEGNIAGGSFQEIARFGDEYLFDKLKKFGVEHITAKDSIVYHLKEGEKSEENSVFSPYTARSTKHLELNNKIIVEPTQLMPYVAPDTRHKEAMDRLGNKVTLLIVNPSHRKEVEECLGMTSSLEFKNINVVLITGNKRIASEFKGMLDIVTGDKTDRLMYDIFHKMYGEYLVVYNSQCNYPVDFLSHEKDPNDIFYFGSGHQNDGLITDYIGHYIFSKKTILENIPMFLGLLIEKDIIEVSFKEFKVVTANIPSPEEQSPDVSSKKIKRLIQRLRNERFVDLIKHIGRRLIR